MSDLRTLLHRLAHAGVDFVIVGDFEQVKKSSERFETEGTQFQVLSIDSLITAKEAMNRPRDREAIRQLQNIKRLKREDPPWMNADLQ